MTRPFQPGYARSPELRGLGFGSVGENVSIGRNCTIIGQERLHIADHVRIDGPCTILVGPDAQLIIGSFVHISAGAHLVATHRLELADFSGLSQGVRIFTATDDYSGASLTNPMVPHAYKSVQGGPVKLGRHVIIGAGTVILPGVKIGEGSSVGALSLVTKSLPDWHICHGIPCRPVRPRSRDLLAQETRFLDDLAQGRVTVPRP